MTTTLRQTHTRTARRATLGLFAALAVTLSALATPLAGAAHAGAADGGVLGRSGLVVRDVGPSQGGMGDSGPTVQPFAIKPGGSDF